MRNYWYGAAVALALGWSVAAAAQTPVERVLSDSLEVVPIAPVTVTVLRTPFQMSEVPYAVSVNTEREIQQGKPGLSVEEALRIIPGVQVENRFNYALGERVTIRGFGARAQFGVRGIRVLVDGIPATLPDGQSSMTHVDVKSLGKVEVVRGPAASLYGNTAGGVIQMEMEAPPPFPISQEFGVIGGSDGLLRLQSSTGGRSGALGYQLNLTRLTSDGYREHSRAENLYLNGRAGFDGERDRVRFVFSAGDSDALNPGSLSAQLQEEDRHQAFANNVRMRTGKTVREGMMGASWTREMEAGGFDLSSYLSTRDVSNPIPSDIIDLDRTGGGVRALLRSAPLGPFGMRVALGAEGDRQRDMRREFQNEAGERGVLRLDQLEHVHNLGFFGQLSAHPLPRLTLLGGLRYDWFHFEADDRFITDTNPDDSGSRTLDALSPSFGATFAISDDLHLYGNIGTTFETPTTVELGNRPEGAGGINPDLEPQQTTSYEVGTRAQIGQRAALQLAIYRADVRNSLIPFELPETAGRTYFRNAGSATHQGVEFGATLVPLDGVSLQAAYTYTDARFDDYTVKGASFAGNEVPGVAPHRIEGVLSYSPRPGGWYAAVEGRHVSELAVDDANNSFSPAYTITEVRGGLGAVQLGTLALDPFLGISNLFDVDYNAAVTVNAFGQRYFESGPGRSFYAGATVRMDRR